LLLAPVEEIEVFLLEVFNRLILRIVRDDPNDHQVASYFSWKGAWFPAHEAVTWSLV
jgi:hypothetical protein